MHLTPLHRPGVLDPHSPSGINGPGGSFQALQDVAVTPATAAAPHGGSRPPRPTAVEPDLLRLIRRPVPALDVGMDPLEARIDRMRETIEVEAERTTANGAPVEAPGRRMEEAAKPMEAPGERMELLGIRQDVLRRMPTATCAA